uniref:glycerophosphodiester phosphodiesterase n=1 Tax=Glycine max TaxID=3847 RepID=A0A0R0J1K0_SOYBN
MSNNLDKFFGAGTPPLVIARGGFSVIFPDSSDIAYIFALENATNIGCVFQNQSKTYPVNGVPTTAYFAVDYTLKDLCSYVVLTQGDYTRAGWFDTNIFEILTVNDLVTRAAPPGLWLNIQHDLFYTQHILTGFLRSIRTQINQRKTKLVFRFLERDEVDPSINQTYGSLLKNLTSIKTFASGILVPKGYIWPVDPTSLYLRTHTSLVYDAHKVGLEVFASDFQNDIPISFNYSYDPVVEYHNFIDNENFSVDGVLSDFPLNTV